MGAGKEQREAPSLGVQSLSHTKCSWNVTASQSRVQGMGGSAPLPPSARLLQGEGEQHLSPASPQPGDVGVPEATSSSVAPTESCHHRPAGAGSCPDAGAACPVDPGWGKRRCRWLRRNVTVWAGRAASLATSPPRTLQFVGSVPELLQQPLALED